MEVFLVVVATAIIQSLFGVGVLLFGTPILLLLGYPFTEVLLILLPVSISINGLQVIYFYRFIDMHIFRNILFITTPFIVISLYFVSKNAINMDILIALFLIFIALKGSINVLDVAFNKLLSYNKFFFILMGIIHGMTNLGGALLTARVFCENIDKSKKRVTVAVSYMTFALFQIITISSFNVQYNFFNLWYVVVGIFVYFFTSRIIFSSISEDKYKDIFTLFLAVLGILLLVKRMISW
jgi:uncharacterized protein